MAHWIMALIVTTTYLIGPLGIVHIIFLYVPFSGFDTLKLVLHPDRTPLVVEASLVFIYVLPQHLGYQFRIGPLMGKGLNI